MRPLEGSCSIHASLIACARSCGQFRSPHCARKA
jgi:hypothetical protein